MAFTGERFCGLGRSIMESVRQYWGGTKTVLNILPEARTMTTMKDLNSPLTKSSSADFV